MPVIRYARGTILLMVLGAAAAPLRAQQTSAPAHVHEHTPEAAVSALRLSDVYAALRDGSPRLAAARASADAVAAMQPSAGLPPDPELQLGAMNFSVPGLSANMPTSMVPSVQLMQMLPVGKLGPSGRIAAQSTEIARAEADEAWWEIRGRAAMSYYELYEADRQLVAMRATLGWLDSFAAAARAMYGAGEGRQSDVLRAGVEVARMQAEIKRMQAMRTAAAARLNALLDRPADTPIPAVALDTLPAAIPGADTLRAWADATRPMLGKGRLELEQARTRGVLARRELWPDLTLGLQYGQRRMPGDEMSAASTERMGSVMVGFTLPVYAGKRQLRMREEARAMERMATAELAEMRADVDARIAELTASLDRSRTLIALYTSQVLPQARANVESAFSSYRVGSVDFMTLVDAQMTASQYEQELAAMQADYGTDIAELEMTIGRELPRGAALMVEAR